MARRQKDPTLTATMRLKFQGMLKGMYRDYAYQAKKAVVTDMTYIQFIKQLESLSYQMNLKGHLMVQDMNHDAFIRGMKRADIISRAMFGVEGMGTAGVPGALGPASYNVLEILNQQSMGQIDGLTALMEKKLKYEISISMLEGEGAVKMAARVAPAVKKELWQAERIVRTEYIRATNKGAEMEFMNLGFECYQVSVEEWCDDAGNCCDICPSMEANGPYRLGDGPMPPFHPNCRCSIYPVECPTKENKRGNKK